MPSTSWPAPGSPLNAYQFGMVRRSDGLKSADEGVTLIVYAPDLAAAETKAKAVNTRQQWRSKMELLDVQLERTPHGPDSHVKHHPTTVQAWYRNEQVGLAVVV